MIGPVMAVTTHKGYTGARLRTPPLAQTIFCPNDTRCCSANVLEPWIVWSHCFVGADMGVFAVI